MGKHSSMTATPVIGEEQRRRNFYLRLCEVIYHNNRVNIYNIPHVTKNEHIIY